MRQQKHSNDPITFGDRHANYVRYDIARGLFGLFGLAHLHVLQTRGAFSADETRTRERESGYSWEWKGPGNTIERAGMENDCKMTIIVVGMLNLFLDKLDPQPYQTHQSNDGNPTSSRFITTATPDTAGYERIG